VRAHPQRARTAGYIWSLLLSHLTLQSRACLHNVLSHTRTRTRTLTLTRKHSQAKKQILKDMALEQFEARSAKKTSRKSAAASPSPTRGRKVRFTNSSWLSRRAHTKLDRDEPFHSRYEKQPPHTSLSHKPHAPGCIAEPAAACEHTAQEQGCGTCFSLDAATAAEAAHQDSERRASDGV